MKKIFRLCNNFVKQVKEDDLNTYASSCAFFIFLSLIPLIMLLFAILPYTPVDSTVLAEWVVKELPAGTGAFILSIMDDVYESSVGLVSVSTIAMLWSAGKGVNSLRAGFNAIDNYVDKRNTVLIRIIASLYTLIFLVGVILLLLLTVSGNFLIKATLGYFPRLSRLFSILMNFRPVISIGVLSIIFMLCYSLLPFKKHKFKEQFPGAVFSAIAWTGFSYLFSLYVNIFNAFSMYGSLTTIIILLFWLYCCMYILFIGDNLNKYFRPLIRSILNKNSKEERKAQLESLEE